MPKLLLYFAKGSNLNIIKRLVSNKRVIIGLLLTIFLLSACEPGPVINPIVMASQSSIKVSVNALGAYTITSQTPAWTFGGNIGHILTDITVHSGSDTIGIYREIDFTYQAGASRGGSIRAYEKKPIVLFTDH